MNICNRHACARVCEIYMHSLRSTCVCECVKAKQLYPIASVTIIASVDAVVVSFRLPISFFFIVAIRLVGFSYYAMAILLASARVPSECR